MWSLMIFAMSEYKNIKPLALEVVNMGSGYVELVSVDIDKAKHTTALNLQKHILYTELIFLLILVFLS